MYSKNYDESPKKLCCSVTNPAETKTRNDLKLPKHINTLQKFLFFMKQKDDNRKSKILISIFIAFIMITSVIGFMFGQYATEQYKFRNYKFTRTDQGLSLVVNKQDVYFDYFPTEANITDFDTAIDSKIKSTKMFYLTYNYTSPYSEVLGKSAYDIILTLSKFGVYVQPAFTNQTSFNVPVITCANATAFVPVIYFKESNQTRAYIDSECIVLESESETDFVRLKDRVLFGFFGILP